jgi:undecaprenyl-diphosphatase
MIPGTSRSASTIIGGMINGLDRKKAAEFSFLLAVPTMFIATSYDIYKNYNYLQFDNLLIYFSGFITAFIFAIISIKFLLKIVSKYSFIPFGIYRIFVGLIFLYIY